MADTTPMEYSYLGNTGLKVSKLCLGTMTFGPLKDGPDQVHESYVRSITDKFIEAGGNFIDTADVYGDSQTQSILGSSLQKYMRGSYRSEVVLATKVRFAPFDGVNDVGLSRRHIFDSVQRSLEALKTDYIDLLQIHMWDPATPLQETLKALHDLVTSGKVTYLGACNLTGWQMQKIVDYCQMYNFTPFVSLQQQWNLLTRQTELELVDVCRNEGIAILPWSPLKGGWLTGKYTRNMTELTPDTRVGWAQQDPKRKNQSHPTYDQFANDEKTWRILDKMEEIASSHEKTKAQVALRWLMQKDTVASVVMGVTGRDQLHENLGALGWELSPEEMAALDDCSANEVPYPYEMITRCSKSRTRDITNRCK